MPRKPPQPTATSYVVLGLLALRPWSAYELAQQSDRTLRWFFPRAERAVYLEVKRLGALGWADATTEHTGRRARTVYSITDAGRAALEAWLEAPPAPTRISSEIALRVFLARESPPGTLRTAIRETRRQAERHLDGIAALAAGPSRAPERMATNVVSLRFLADINVALRDWAIWAEDAVTTVESDDVEAIAAQTRATLEQLVALAQTEAQNGSTSSAVP